MTGFNQQGLNEGILNGSRGSSRLVAIQFTVYALAFVHREVGWVK